MRLLRILYQIFIFTLATGLLLVSCTSEVVQPTSESTAMQTEPSKATDASASPTPGEPMPDVPKSMTILFTKQIDTFNPLLTELWFSQLTHQIWNCWAWDFDENTNPRPVLVKEIPSIENGGISADGRTITLHLREDIHWSDGTPISAADFAFTYQMWINPQNSVVSRTPYDRIENMTTPDEHTIVITFSEPYAPWIYSLWHGLLPSHVLQPVYDSLGSIDNAEWNRAPEVGCGPYRFVDWQENQIHFTANQDYWLGEAIIDDLYIRFVSDDAEQSSALKTSQGDLGTRLSYADIPDLSAAGIQIQQVFSGWNEGWFIYLNPEKGHPALQDIRVRQAIAYAFDRAALIQTVLMGQTQPAISYWDNTPYIDPGLQPWPYDPARANQLLDEAGWTDHNANGIRDNGVEELILVYGTITRKERQDVQALIQDQLSAVGIQLELVHYDSNIFFNSYNAGSPAATGKLDIFEYSVKPPDFPDPDTPDFLCDEIPDMWSPFGVNWSGFCNEELDSLFKLQASQIDPAARQQTFHQISRLIYDNVYFLGLWQDSDLWGLSPRLKNIKLSAVTPFYNIMKWDTDG